MVVVVQCYTVVLVLLVMHVLEEKMYFIQLAQLVVVVALILAV